MLPEFSIKLLILSAMTVPFATLLNVPAADHIPANGGEIVIQPINHATLQITFGGHVIDIDPTPQADFTGLAAPDLILITDIHGDHLDPPTVKKIRKASTIVVAPQAAAAQLESPTVMANGEAKTVAGVAIEAAADVQPYARSRRRAAVPRQGPRQRLHPHARRQAHLHRRRHRVHAGDEGAQEHRRRVPADEPAVHDAAGRSRRRASRRSSRRSSIRTTIAGRTRTCSRTR